VTKKIIQIARRGEKVAPLSAETRARMQPSHDWVEQAVSAQGRVIYGVNTGFGVLATTRIAAEQARQLSRNLVLGCVSGVGKPLPKEIVRAMMVIRANMLARGFSAVRPQLAQTLIDMLNAGVTPYVPEKGSLGASGDLAPLAHIAVVMTAPPQPERENYSGQAWLGDELLSGEQAMERAGIARPVLEAKEGLALSNGIDFMAAAGALAVYDGESLLRQGLLAAALSLEALLALSDAFHPALHRAAGQPGQQQVAAQMRALLHGSRLIDSQPGKVQDAYSLRCIPQVLGPVLDSLAFIRARFSTALNAVTDNPLIFPAADGQGYFSLSGGNFHGQGPAMWLDFLAIAIAEVGSIAERRVFRLLTPELSSGLPSMLVRKSGLDGGLMMGQYTAAALVSDNKTLAHPDSVDSIPSCANQEDHVSMGANAARHALEVLENVRHILAIELLSAAQALDLRPDGPGKLGRGGQVIYPLVREQVPFMEHDRELTPDILRLADLIRSETLIKAAAGVDRNADPNSAD